MTFAKIVFKKAKKLAPRIFRNEYGQDSTVRGILEELAHMINTLDRPALGPDAISDLRYGHVATADLRLSVRLHVGVILGIDDDV